jgi:hypothetical protein
VSDIVDRLRDLTEEWWECCGDIHLPLTEAADEIVRLRNQLDAARTGKALLALEAEFALSDQLAEALRDEHDFRMGCWPVSQAALAAYDAARKEPQ